MKVFYLIVAIAFLNLSSAKARPIIDLKNANDSLTQKAKQLRLLYKLSKSSSKDVRDNYQRKFFDAFPNTFKQLDDLYGYGDKPSLLYKDAPKHILELFNNLNNISDTAYYKKIISIAIGGHWDADAINYFQDGLHSHVLNNWGMTIYTLRRLSKKNIYSFWYFYFDGPHPKKQLDTVLFRLQKSSPEIYALMISAHKAVLKERERE